MSNVVYYDVESITWPKYELRMPTMYTQWYHSAQGVRTWWIDTFGWNRKKDAERYLFLIECMHNSVVSFLDENPNVAEKFLKKESGFLYFDVAKMCGADDKWGKEAYDLISKRRDNV